MVNRTPLGVSIVVPCCNEEDAARLLPEKLYPTLVSLARQRPVELILVDDGSRDATWEQLTLLERERQPFQITLARHATNLGLGAALLTGSAAASNDIVVTLDADGTYPFEIVEVLVAQIDAGADVATASPYHPDGRVEGVSALRLLFSRGASLCYRVLVDRRVHTWTAMVRAYRADVLRAALPEESGYLNVARTLVEARRRGARIVETPAVLSTRTVGQSKAKVARITRSHLRYMRGLFWLRLTGRFWIETRASTVAVAGHG